VSFVIVCRKKSFRAVGCGLVYCLFFLWMARVACADGTYQRTKDGKTVVWNDKPKPGDIATWSGDRDRDGYATGFGTLTWYTARELSGAGPKQTLYAYYFGNMIRGKFNGPVNGHSKGVTNHAVFTQGTRTGRWAAGPAPSWRMPPSNREVSAEGETRSGAEDIAEFNSPPPGHGATAAERPLPDYEAVHQQSSSTAVRDVPAEGPTAVGKDPLSASAASQNPKHEADASLRSLMGPPPALRTNSEPPSGSHQENSASSSSQPNRLTKVQVIDLADSEARKHGYDLTRYERPDPQFDAIDTTWSLFYHPRPVNGTEAPAKHFTIAIDDKTNRTAIVPGR
jgi:hypothetical protein